MALVDTLDEQALLEQVLDDSKPTVPDDCRSLHYLLFTPFRYGAHYPRGSRFRRAGLSPGVFYASLQVTTAVAEMAFWRLLFHAESPETPWPANAGEYTAFSVRFSAGKGLDLTRPPLRRDAHRWTHPTDYSSCQALSDTARELKVLAIRYQSARAAGRASRCWRARRLHRGRRWNGKGGGSTSARWAFARSATSPSSGWRSIAARSRATDESPH